MGLPAPEARLGKRLVEGSDNYAKSIYRSVEYNTWVLRFKNPRIELEYLLDYCERYAPTARGVS